MKKGSKVESCPKNNSGLEYCEKQKNNKNYFRDFICADTETSWNHNWNHPICWINEWGFSFRGFYYHGRKPSGFIEALKEIETEYEFGDNDVCVIFIHNAGFDWSYLDKYFEQLGTGEKLFVKPHVLLTARYGHFEIRDTLRISNRSLLKWGNDLDVEHKKKAGAIDYDEIIYQDADL